MQELWKPVQGYEQCYEVSNAGRVRSLDRLCAHSNGVFTKRKGVVLKASLRAGYPFVLLQDHCRKRQVHIHRLVAAAFCEQRPGCSVVNHLDGNKLNNSAANLEWTTFGGNAIHAYATGLSVAARGEDHGHSRLSDIQVAAIRNAIISGASGASLAKAYGVSVMTISMIRNGKGWSHVATGDIDACRSAPRTLSHKGEAHPNAKLNEQIVSEIVRRLYSRHPQKDIAKDLCVCAASVSRINLGLAWKHVRVDGCGEPPYFLASARRNPAKATAPTPEPLP